jgi:putative restriction endonuclease
MNFADWMLHRGLSQSSVDKYVGAIQGPISSWAIENQLTAGPLTSFTSQAAFIEMALKIRSLPVFQERNERGHHMYSSALAKFSEYLSEGYGNDVELDIDAILDDDKLSKTERRDLVKCRIGQGTFRQKLVAYWNGCAVTAFKDINLLVASHIKPWRASSNAERLNPFNGLLLTPNLDKAFDSGLITFKADGSISLSPLLTEPEKLGIDAHMRVVLSAKHEPFMSFHRVSVFRPS